MLQPSSASSNHYTTTNMAWNSKIRQPQPSSDLQITTSSLTWLRAKKLAPTIIFSVSIYSMGATRFPQIASVMPRCFISNRYTRNESVRVDRDSQPSFKKICVGVLEVSVQMRRLRSIVGLKQCVPMN